MRMIKGQQGYNLHEVSKMINEKESNIRYILRIVGIKGLKDEKNNRLYTKDDIEYIKLLNQYKNKGLEIKTIKMALEGKIIKFANKNEIEPSEETNIIVNKSVNDLTDETDENAATSIEENNIINFKDNLPDESPDNDFDFGNGDIVKKIKMLIEYTNVDTFRKMELIDKKLDNLITVEDNQKKVIEKQNEKVMNKLNDVVNENRKLNTELTKKLDKRDIELTTKLVNTLEKKRNEKKKKPFLKRIFSTD